MLAGSYIRGTISRYQNETLTVARKALKIRRSGPQYVAMVTKLLFSYCGAHLVKSTAKNQTFLIQIS